MKLLIVLLCGASFSSGGDSSPQNGAKAPSELKLAPQELQRQAEAARDANKPDEAIKLYKQVLTARPTFAEGWWWLGTFQYQQEKWADCRNSFRRFVALAPKAGPGYALLGVCEYKNGDAKFSIEHLEHANELGLPPKDPMTSEARYYLAVLHTKAGNFERAMMMLTLITRQTGSTPDVVTLAGIAALRKAINPQALPDDDRELVVRMGRAMITGAERHAPEAIQQMKEIAADFPKSPNVHYLLGAYMLEQGDPDGGMGELAKELDIDPNHLPALITMAMEYLKRSEPEKAKPLGERAVKIAPGNFAARTAYGRALVESDQAVAGLKELEVAVKLAPDSPQVQFALAGAYAKLGRKAEAARAREEFTRLKKIVDARPAQ